MNKFQITLVIVLSLIVIPAVIYAATIPFGGKVITIQPCNTGLLLTLQAPMKGVIQLMWLTGNLPYMMHVPPHPAQNLLGRYLMAPTPCTLGNTVVGSGFPIFIHGSSM